MVVHRGRQRVIPLPPEGRLSIGRAPDNDVVIAESLVSRRHAVLHIAAQLSIEDLSSANGTHILAGDVTPTGARPPDDTGVSGCRARGVVRTRRMRERLVPPGSAALLPTGTTLQIGSCLLSIEQGASGPAAPVADTEIAIADPRMRELHALVDRVAATDINVLLLGETGVGKEVFATRIHAASARSRGTLVKLNCGAIVESLLESELFGHEKGAFTGAAASKPGLFEAAAGGTVFLDEVGELPLPLQVKLLRVLEDREVTRIGGLRPRPIDCRFVAATNVDLEQSVAAGRFRRDLYYRLNGVALTIPPLKDRPDEIEPLAMLFARRAAAAHRRELTPSLSPGALERLLAHTWPGNIRELRNVIERAIVVATASLIEASDLPTSLAPAEPVESTPEPVVASAGGLKELRRMAVDAERRQIVEALEAAGGNQTRAAELLGITRRALIVRLERHNVPRPRKRP